MEDPDFVVIGSGPTGAAAALALADLNASVTMLESGTMPSGGLVLQLNGRNIISMRTPMSNPVPYQASLDPRTRWFHELAPGGLSNYWSCAVPRFHPEDFTEGARLGEEYRWPITYKQLEPHYTRLEKLMGVRGSTTAGYALPSSYVKQTTRLPHSWRQVAEAAMRRQRGFVPLPRVIGNGWGFKYGGTPFNSFSDLVLRLIKVGRLSLKLGAHVLRLEHDLAGNVDRVIYLDKATGAQASIKCKGVIVAAGPIGTARILLDSRSSQFPAGLGNHNGLVGRYLCDHVHDMRLIEVNRPLARLAHEAYFPRAPYELSEPLRAAGVVVGARYSRADRILTMTPVPSRRFGIVVFGTMLPRPTNRVCLTGEQDEHGQSGIDIKLQFEESDLEPARTAKDEFCEVLDDAGLRPKSCSDFLGPPGSAVHFAGTARMHDSDRYGVTNQWARLHSVRNVAIADASTFTTCVEKNPTITAMAIACMAANKLGLDVKEGLLSHVAG